MTTTGDPPFRKGDPVRYRRNPVGPGASGVWFSGFIDLIWFSCGEMCIEIMAYDGTTTEGMFPCFGDEIVMLEGSEVK